MRLLCWGTYDVGKPRTRILHGGLRAIGVLLTECHANVWEGIEDKSQVSGLMRRVTLLVKWLVRYPGLLLRFMLAARPDIVLVGFPGILDVIALAPFARWRGVPIVWDMFMSLYDTVVLDRCLVPTSGLRARLLHRLERFAIQRADLVFLDTEAHARRTESLYGLPAGACGSVWVGAEVEQFRVPSPRDAATSPSTRLHVLFYGQFIPLHGIDTIVAAARLLRHEAIDWTLIGRGQEAQRIRLMLEEEPLPNIRWIDWVPYTELRNWIADADLCLGIFGTSGKADCVIPNKVFQILAAERPLVTRDSPAIREILQHQPPCAYLVRAGEPQALAAAVREHASRFGQLQAEYCHASSSTRITGEAIGRQFKDMINRRGLVPGGAADAR